MTFDVWLTFTVTLAFIIAIPGPTVMLVVGHAMVHGTRAAMATVSAIALADLVLIGLSMVGVGALLMTSKVWFLVLQLLGAGYLLHLGWRMWHRPAPAPNEKVGSPGFELARQGFVSTLLNPKSILFVFAFFPQFISSEHSIAPQTALLTVTFLGVGLPIAAAYAVLASRAGRVMADRGFVHAINRLSAVVIGGAGALSLVSGIV